MTRISLYPVSQPQGFVLQCDRTIDLVRTSTAKAKDDVRAAVERIKRLAQQTGDSICRDIDMASERKIDAFQTQRDVHVAGMEGVARSAHLANAATYALSQTIVQSVRQRESCDAELKKVADLKRPLLLFEEPSLSASFDEASVCSVLESCFRVHWENISLEKTTITDLPKSSVRPDEGFVFSVEAKDENGRVVQAPNLAERIRLCFEPPAKHLQVRETKPERGLVVFACVLGGAQSGGPTQHQLFLVSDNRGFHIRKAVVEVASSPPPRQPSPPPQPSSLEDGSSSGIVRPSSSTAGEVPHRLSLRGHSGPAAKKVSSVAAEAPSLPPPSQQASPTSRPIDLLAKLRGRPPLQERDPLVVQYPAFAPARIISQF